METLGEGSDRVSRIHWHAARQMSPSAPVTDVSSYERRQRSSWMVLARAYMQFAVLRRDALSSRRCYDAVEIDLSLHRSGPAGTTTLQQRAFVDRRGAESSVVLSAEKRGECPSLVPTYNVTDASLLPVSTLQVRGPRKHMKRLAAPSSWMLDKLSGTYAPRPAPGPHKIREALPLIVLLRNRLKYALTGREVIAITAQRLIKVDGKVRTEPTYPTGFMDVVSIEKSGEHFRILYDVKGRFVVHRITPEEGSYKLLKVKKAQLGAKGGEYLKRLRMKGHTAEQRC